MHRRSLFRSFSGLLTSVFLPVPMGNCEPQQEYTECPFPDYKTRLEHYRKSVLSGQMTVDDVRRLEGLPPIDGEA